MKKKNILLIGIGAAVATAAAILLWKRNDKSREKPPKRAPQLKLKNPGAQSEFTSMPSESELG